MQKADSPHAQIFEFLSKVMRDAYLGRIVAGMALDEVCPAFGRPLWMRVLLGVIVSTKRCV